jgi:hypothetical protein
MLYVREKVEFKYLSHVAAEITSDASNLPAIKVTK